MLDWLTTRASSHGSKVAVINPVKGTQHTYADLNRRAQNLANYLHDQGIGQGDRVGIFGPNDTAVFDIFFACVKLGAIFIPLNWRLKSNEVGKVVEDAGLEFIFYATAHLERLENVPEEYIKIDIDTPDYEAIVEPDVDKAFDPVALDRDALAMLIYTSGSTGMPKGVQITHRSYITNIQQEIASWEIGENTKTIVSTPMFHILGLIDTALPVLYKGGTLILDRYYDKDKINGLIAEYEPNILIMIPTMYYGILDGANFNATNLQKIATLVQGGAPPLEKVTEAFKMFGITILNAYGLTESPLLTFNHPQIAEAEPKSIGLPVLGIDLKIVDDQGNEVPRGEMGEIIVKGENVTTGYWNLPHENAKAFTEDGYFRTGDLATMSDLGAVTIINRTKELIITGGENVLPSEVEAILNKHPLVQTAIVVGYDHPKYGESVSAAVKLNTEALNYDTWEDTLNEFCLKNLAGYKTPKLYLELDELPLNSVAKPDRLEIQRRMNELAQAQQA